MQVTQSKHQDEPVQELQNLIFNDQAMTQLFRLAETMANAKASIPAHLKGNSADCFAVCMQAAQWRMNPFAVAQKTHVINGTLGYEAQLVNAVITTMAPTQDRLHFEWFGPWENVLGKFAVKKNGDGKEYRTPAWGANDEVGLGVNVWATMTGEDSPRVLNLLLTQARTRNSTLWADDPRQQLAYLAIKRWSRLYCPDVILGVYTPDELQDFSSNEREVGTPHKTPDHGVISDDQKAILIAAAAAAGKDEGYICSKAKVASLDDLVSSRFDPALNHLNQLPKVYQHEEAINV